MSFIPFDYYVCFLLETVDIIIGVLLGTKVRVQKF